VYKTNLRRKKCQHSRKSLQQKGMPKKHQEPKQFGSQVKATRLRQLEGENKDKSFFSFFYIK